MKDWHVGQRVVCIKKINISNRPPQYQKKEKVPAVGQILTIRDIVPSVKNIGKVGFRFEELTNPILQYTGGMFELIYSESNFRPLDESRLDQFRVHLNTVPGRVKEEA